VIKKGWLKTALFRNEDVLPHRMPYHFGLRNIQGRLSFRNGRGFAHVASRNLPHYHSRFQKISRSEHGAARREFAELITAVMPAFSVGLAVGAMLCRRAAVKA
jgi:hypothetical protein